MDRAEEYAAVVWCTPVVVWAAVVPWVTFYELVLL